MSNLGHSALERRNFIAGGGIAMLHKCREYLQMLQVMTKKQSNEGRVPKSIKRRSSNVI